jgi:outer membrane biosynthesis protein TonB
MEQKGTPVARIRCPRGSDPRAFTAEAHRSGYLMAYAEPPYPRDAKAHGIEGKVVLDALIDCNGVLPNAVVSS